ncbi:MAG: hypothetical protein A3K65_03510 [Euryarchaeota archaeon RBG_16_68_12]|nr:MAG: hypothetical protein A3K65_03510 [Euryarchaeota archaeon RBG_16_68_12]
MTTIIRSDAPPRSLGAVVAMAGLAAGALFFVVLVFLGIAYGWSQPLVAVWFGIVFLLLAVFLDVYRREFVPDELIHKKRRPKVVYKRDIR